jgi:hypothetical protein
MKENEWNRLDLKNKIFGVLMVYGILMLIYLFLVAKGFLEFFELFSLLAAVVMMVATLGAVAYLLEFDRNIIELLLNFKVIIKNFLVIKSKVSLPFSRKLLKLTYSLYSSKTQKETFEALVGDWEEEKFEALSKKEIWKARWINARYTYAFLGAMWQKSPLGDLLEFISKIAK